MRLQEAKPRGGPPGSTQRQRVGTAERDGRHHYDKIQCLEQRKGRKTKREAGEKAKKETRHPRITHHAIRGR